MPFLIIFVLIPFLEIATFMAVGDRIGFWTALLLSLFTAILGGSIVRYQGLKTFFAAQNTMRQGQIPSRELFDGLCLIAAGAMLMTPGFITDTLGFLLLIPSVRHALREKLSRSARFQAAYFESETCEQPFYRGDASAETDIIEGEYEKVDDKSGN